MKENQFIVGLDIGSYKTRFAVGQVDFSSPHPQIDVLSLQETYTEGFTKGNISNIEDLVSTISEVLEKVSLAVDLPIEEVAVGIAGDHIVSQRQRGTVAISKANNEIDANDIERVIESVKSVAIPPNYENLHLLPISFKVDNQSDIKDPLGMVGSRLEAEVQVINGLATKIKNFLLAINRANLEVSSLVFSILATAEAVLNKKQKELGVLVLDIGHTLTKGAIYEEGRVIYTFNIPLGSSHITSDLAIGLRSSLEAAELVKRRLGNLNLASLKRSDQFNILEYEVKAGQRNASELKEENSKKNMISKRFVNEIIEARVEEIFSYVATELKKAGRFGKLPAGVVLTGGGSKLPYLTEYVKSKLLLPASLGYPLGVKTSLEKFNDLAYAPLAGLLLWEVFQADEEEGLKRFLPKFSLPFPQLKKKLKDLFKSLTP